MFFDGVVNQFEVGVRIILLTLEGEVVPIAKKLCERPAFQGFSFKREMCISGPDDLGSVGWGLPRVAGQRCF